MRRLLLVVTVVALVACLGVCTSGAAQKKYLIAFSQSCMTHPWRVTLTNDMKNWAAKLGVDLIWTDGQLDAAKQLKDVEDLLAKKPDVLIITPLQKDALTPTFDLAKKANVPLIVIDREIDATPGTGTFISLITQDFVETGRMKARLLAKALIQKKGAPKGNIFYLEGTIGSSVSIDLYNGFLDVVAKEYPDMKIVARQSGEDTRGPAMKVTETILQRFPKGTLDAICAYNDEEAFGAIDAIKEAGRTELLGMIVSFGGQQEELRRIAEGEIFATVTVSPYYGEIALKTALAYLKGEKVPVRQSLQPEVYSCDTPENRDRTRARYLYMKEHNLVY